MPSMRSLSPIRAGRLRHLVVRRYASAQLSRLNLKRTLPAVLRPRRS
jgi:hypothetical protein